MTLHNRHDTLCVPLLETNFVLLTMRIKKMKTTVMNRFAVITILFMLLIQTANAQISDKDISKIEKAIPSSTKIKTEKPRRILIFSRTEGYRHDSIPFAAKAFDLMGNKTGA